MFLAFFSALTDFLLGLGSGILWIGGLLYLWIWAGVVYRRVPARLSPLKQTRAPQDEGPRVFYQPTWLRAAPAPPTSASFAQQTSSSSEPGISSSFSAAPARRSVRSPSQLSSPVVLTTSPSPSSSSSSSTLTSPPGTPPPTGSPPPPPPPPSGDEDDVNMEGAPPSWQDIRHLPVNLRNTLTLQLGGRKRARVRYTMSLHGNRWLSCRTPNDKLSDSGATSGSGSTGTMGSALRQDRGSQHDLNLLLQGIETSGEEVFDLTDCYLLMTTLSKWTLEIVNPNAAFKPGLFQLYLIFDNEDKYNQWYLYLTSRGILQVKPPHFFESFKAIPELLPVLLSYGPSCSCTWLNKMLGRWFQSMRDGDRLLKVLRKKVAEKIATKLVEKGLDGSISDVRLLEVRVGSGFPVFASARHYVGHSEAFGQGSELALDYNGNGDGFFFAFKARAHFGRHSFEIKADVTLQSLRGTLNLHEEPTGQFYSISFNEKPVLELGLKVSVGNKTMPELFDLGKLIGGKVRQSLSEKLVPPNRKYARIPKTTKTFWEQEHTRMWKATQLKIDSPVHTANGELTKSSSLSLSAPVSDSPDSPQLTEPIEGKKRLRLSLFRRREGSN